MPLGTAAIIGLTLGTAGAQAGANIYASKRAGDVNRQSLQAQERADVAALAFQREQLALAEKARQDDLAINQQRWNDYVDVHRPHWQAGQQMFGNLMQMAGVNPGSMQAPQMPAANQPPPTGVTTGATPPSRAMPQPMAGAASLYDMATGAGAPSAGRVPSRGRQIAASMPMPTPSNGMTMMDLANMAMMAKDFQRGRGQQTGAV